MLYGFIARDVARIRQMLAAYERGRVRINAPSHLPPTQHQQDSFLGYVGTAIPAGDLGTAVLVNLDESSPPVQAQETDLPTIPVYNPYSGDLGPGVYLLTREPSQGYYVPTYNTSVSYGFAESDTSDVVANGFTELLTWSKAPWPTNSSGGSLFVVPPGDGTTVNIPVAGLYLIGAEVTWDTTVSSDIEGTFNVLLSFEGVAGAGASSPVFSGASDTFTISAGGGTFQASPCKPYLAENASIAVYASVTSPASGVVACTCLLWAVYLGGGGSGGGGSGGGTSTTGITSIDGVDGIIADADTPSKGTTTLGLGVIDCGSWV